MLSGKDMNAAACPADFNSAARRVRLAVCVSPERWSSKTRANPMGGAGLSRQMGSIKLSTA